MTTTKPTLIHTTIERYQGALSFNKVRVEGGWCNATTPFRISSIAAMEIAFSGSTPSVTSRKIVPSSAATMKAELAEFAASCDASAAGKDYR